MGFTLFLNTSFLVIVFCVSLIVPFHSSSEHVVLRSNRVGLRGEEQDCKSFHSLEDSKAKCLYLKSNDPCVSQGYVDYLYLFYCKFGGFPLLGHSLLFLWLLVLFYLLANTASEYFCPSLDNLSKLLRLSPTIAGVTLLSLGNGACDVFATLVSFKGSGTRDIGFNTVLGGASFVSCVVVGIVSIAIRHRGIRVKKWDLINVPGAIGFCLMYVVYVVVVYVLSTRGNKGVCGDADGEIGCDLNHGGGSDLSVPMLSGMEKGLVNGAQECNMKIERKRCCLQSSMCSMLLFVLEMPLYLPRRLTIPGVCEERWSKVYASFNTRANSLAWGNSLGDLVTNLTMALNGDQKRPISVGNIGTFGGWIGWALVVLIRRDMKLMHYWEEGFWYLLHFSIPEADSDTWFSPISAYVVRLILQQMIMNCEFLIIGIAISH
ncbi:hypothetical protein JHK85_054137 [Glycine max]|nr:hypothetical protein JHK85_054137 [Glycine max]